MERGRAGKRLAGPQERSEPAKGRNGMEAEAPSRPRSVSQARPQPIYYVLTSQSSLQDVHPHLTPPTAHTPWGCGDSHEFVHLDFVAWLQAAGVIKTRNCGHMHLTTARRRERLPLREARLSLDIGGFHCRGWFAL